MVHIVDQIALEPLFRTFTAKKYKRSTLFRVKQFHIIFSNKKVAPLAQQLTCSHYIELLPK